MRSVSRNLAKMSVDLDAAATAPLRPEAHEAMDRWLRHGGGNPSSAHGLGRQARTALEDARDEIAALAGAAPAEVVFTSGGTEADNLAIKAGRGLALGCVATEHKAVLLPAAAAGAQRVGVKPDGTVDLRALKPMNLEMLSVAVVNNEIGTVQDLGAIRTAIGRKAILHTDAAQAPAWIDVALGCAPADLITLSAHKFGGPAGIGALVVRRHVSLEPLVLGGGQERELRSGTQNVAGAVGMAVALRMATVQRANTVARVAKLRDILLDALEALPGIQETVPRNVRVANNAHVLLPQTDIEALLVLLDDAGIYASAGSACASGAMEPSHVLEAIGAPGLSGLRLTLSWLTTPADVEIAVKAITQATDRLAA